MTELHIFFSIWPQILTCLFTKYCVVNLALQQHDGKPLIISLYSQLCLKGSSSLHFPLYQLGKDQLDYPCYTYTAKNINRLPLMNV